MDQLQAVREGNWKLHLALDNKYDGIDKTRSYGKSKMQLIDLSKDAKEKYDVSGQSPEVVKRLLQHAEEISKKLGDPTHQGDQTRPALTIENPEPLIMK